MIKATLTFNGEVQVALNAETEADKQLLALAFNGKEVKRIDAGDSGGVILRMVPADKKAASDV